MPSPLKKIASRAALHRRYESEISWFEAWRLALSVPFQRKKQYVLAREAMNRYDMPDARVSFLSASGNLVFRVDHADRSFALRISGHGRRTMAQVHAELAYAQVLQRALGVRIAEVIPGRDGQPVQTLNDTTGDTRTVVLFAWMPGEAYGKQLTVDRMESLGRLQARMHLFSVAGEHSIANDRPVLLVDEVMRWTQMPPRGETMLTDADKALIARIGADLRKVVPRIFELSPQKLVHYDLQGSNLLLEGDELGIIDFDDCLTAPTLLDMATSLSFTTPKPGAEALRAAYMKGYSTVLELAPELKDLIDPTIALIALREVQRVLEWPLITTNPWGPEVLAISLKVLRTMDARMNAVMAR